MELELTPVVEAVKAHYKFASSAATMLSDVYYRRQKSDIYKILHKHMSTVADSTSLS